jgi:hypothetical protein
MEHFSQIGRWNIRFDPDLTREIYTRVLVISCRCMDCANFRAVGEAAFSPPFLNFLKRLGIDPRKPAELCHYGTNGEPMPTQGWFHFVGHIEGGTDAWRQVSESSYSLDSEPFRGVKSIGFTSRLSLVPEAFEGQPLVQLEFETTVPWVTATPFT